MAIKKVTLETFRTFKEESDKRYAKASELGTLAKKSEVSETELSSALLATITGKADKATTLAGYGITDAMTSTAIAEAIATAIAGTSHSSITIAESVPEASSAQENVMYFVKNDGTGYYDIYCLIDGEVVRIDDTSVNLTDYVTSTQLTEALNGFIKLTNLSASAEGAGNVITAVSYDNSTGAFTFTKGITALTETDFEDITAEEIKSLFVDSEA